MKSFFFQVVAYVSAFFIRLNSGIANILNTWIGRTAYALMAVIDREKLALYEQVATTDGGEDLKLQQTELNLLNAASQVRDHAKETEEWTEKHTDAINAIAESLIVHFGWEEGHVNQYMKEVVESIDGLEFDLEE